MTQCAIEECASLAQRTIRGYCETHYNKLWRTGKIPRVQREPYAPGQTCALDDCVKPVAKGELCNAHYIRKRRYGDPRITKSIPPGTYSTCTIKGCDRPFFTHEWCKLHYERWKTHGDVHWIPAERPKVCAIDGCDRTPDSRGWCPMHYQRWKRHGDATWEPPIYPETCTLEGCDKPYRSSGLCESHYKMATYVRPLGSDRLNAKIAYWGWRCWMCGGPFEAMDHVKPVVAGGLNLPSNLRPACRSCNSKKNGRWPVDIRVTIKRDLP